MQRAEAPGVAEPEREAGVELNVDVIVHTGGRAAIDDTDVTGHAQMQDGRAVLRADQNVFRTTLYGRDALPGQLVVQSPWHGPAQPPLADDDARYRVPEQERFDAASAGFYFR